MSSCKNSPFIKIAQNLLNLAKQTGVTSTTPLTQTHIKEIETALLNYEKDCRICQINGNNYSCFKIAEEKFIRAMPFIRDTIYPWNNYDWDYSNFINNNYSVLSTNASKKGTFTAMFDNIGAFIKLTQGYLINPNPNSKSKSGGSSKNDDINWYECNGIILDANGNKTFDTKMAALCRAKNQIKNTNPLPPPTKDPFLKKYPTNGKNSSSYYVKIGYCPKNKLNTQKQCENKGYTWIPNPLNPILKALPFSGQQSNGSCYQPRYAYINNTPGVILGGVKLEGLIPSLANDFMALTPDKLMAAFQGQNIQNYLDVQPCLPEGFVNFKLDDKQLNQTKKDTYKWVYFIMVFLICYLFLVL